MIRLIHRSGRSEAGPVAASHRSNDATSRGDRDGTIVRPAKNRRPHRGKRRGQSEADYCAGDRGVGTSRVTTFAERSRQSGTRGAIFVFQ